MAGIKRNPKVNYLLDPTNLVITFPSGQNVENLFSTTLSGYTPGYEVRDAFVDLIDMHGGKINQGWEGFKLVPVNLPYNPEIDRIKIEVLQDAARTTRDTIERIDKEIPRLIDLNTNQYINTWVVDLKSVMSLRKDLEIEMLALLNQLDEAKQEANNHTR